MNNQRRKQIVEIINALTLHITLLEKIQEDEQNSLNNRMEYFAMSDSIQNSEDAIELMTEALSNLYDAVSSLENIE